MIDFNEMEFVKECEVQTRVKDGSPVKVKQYRDLDGTVYQVDWDNKEYRQVVDGENFDDTWIKFICWEFEILGQKNTSGGFTILTRVLKAGTPGAFSDWDSPHKVWEDALRNAENKLEAVHSPDHLYMVEGQEYFSVKDALANLSKPN